MCVVLRHVTPSAHLCFNWSSFSLWTSYVRVGLLYTLLLAKQAWVVVIALTMHISLEQIYELPTGYNQQKCCLSYPWWCILEHKNTLYELLDSLYQSGSCVLRFRLHIWGWHFTFLAMPYMAFFSVIRWYQDSSRFLHILSRQ